MRNARAARAGGFTLLEVLVAFIIAALALGTMFSAVLGGVRTAAVADRIEEAVTLARSRLAAAQAALDAGVLNGGQQEGDDGGGFHWTVAVRPVAGVVMPLADETVANAPRQHATLFAIAVTIGWAGDGGHREFRLDGARLEARAAPKA